jgi:microcystin-dependent protein
LTSFTETDPIFVASPANGITGTLVTNWNSAFGWGNHASAGYLTSFTETDPIFAAWNKSTGISITASQVSDFQTSVTNNAAVVANTAKNSYPAADATKLAGIEALAEVNVNADWNANSGDAEILNKPTTVNGYGITDAMTTAHDANAVTAANIADWSTAFGWGDHETAGYLKNTSETAAGDLMFYDGAVWVSKRLLVSNTGGNQSFNNMQPFLTVNYCIALVGIFPSRNGVEPFIGAIEINAFNFAPRGFATCDGQLISIAQNTALFSLLGTTYGGNGQTTFALPDLRGRVAIHQGGGFGLSNRSMGETGGSESVILTVGNLPAHTHAVVYE